MVDFNIEVLNYNILKLEGIKMQLILYISVWRCFWDANINIYLFQINKYQINKC